MSELRASLVLALAARPGSTAVELVARLASTGRPTTAFVVDAVLRADPDFTADQSAPPRWSLASHPSCPIRADEEPYVGGSSARGVDVAAAPVGVSPSAGRDDLLPWHREALDAWCAADRRGIVESVHGSDTTPLVVHVVRQEVGQCGRVVVLVPDVRSQQRWYDRLLAELPDVEIERLGGGAELAESWDVAIAVVHSATRSAGASRLASAGLLIADHCDRYGSPGFVGALASSYQRRLGLRIPRDLEPTTAAARIDSYFRGTCYRYGHRQARADGLVGDVRVNLVPLRLTPDERDRYDALSQQLDIESAAPGRTGPGATARSHLADYGVAPRADVVRAARRDVLDEAGDRRAFVRALGELDPSKRIAVFTSSRWIAESVAADLARSSRRAGVLHPQLTRSAQEQLLNRFQEGALPTLCLAGALDLTPLSVDAAVFLTSTRTRRQLVDRLGWVVPLDGRARPVDLVLPVVEGTLEDPAMDDPEGFVRELCDLAAAVRRLAAPRDLRDLLRGAGVVHASRAEVRTPRGRETAGAGSVDPSAPCLASTAQTRRDVALTVADIEQSLRAALGPAEEAEAQEADISAADVERALRAALACATGAPTPEGSQAEALEGPEGRDDPASAQALDRGDRVTPSAASPANEEAREGLVAVAQVLRRALEPPAVVTRAAESGDERQASAADDHPGAAPVPEAGVPLAVGAGVGASPVLERVAEMPGPPVGAAAPRWAVPPGQAGPASLGPEVATPKGGGAEAPAPPARARHTPTGSPRGARSPTASTPAEARWAAESRPAPDQPRTPVPAASPVPVPIVPAEILPRERPARSVWRRLRSRWQR